MAELADALDLGSSGATRKSSSLFTRTNIIQKKLDFRQFIPYTTTQHQYKRVKKWHLKKAAKKLLNWKTKKPVISIQQQKTQSLKIRRAK